MPTINNILEERGSRYGKFADHAKIAQGLQDVLHNMPNWPTMNYDMRQALVVITDKIARIGNGDPFYDDNWVDIIGYATLVLNRLNMIESEDLDLYPPSEENATYATGGYVGQDGPYIVGENPSQQYRRLPDRLLETGGTTQLRS